MLPQKINQKSIYLLWSLKQCLKMGTKSWIYCRGAWRELLRNYLSCKRFTHSFLATHPLKKTGLYIICITKGGPFNVFFLFCFFCFSWLLASVASGFCGFWFSWLSCFCGFCGFCGFWLFGLSIYLSISIFLSFFLAAVLLSLFAFAFPVVFVAETKPNKEASKEASKQASTSCSPLDLVCCWGPPQHPPRHEICTSSPTPAPATKINILR